MAAIFLFLEHQHGRRDVMWKPYVVFCAKSIVTFVRSIVLLANPEARSIKYDTTRNFKLLSEWRHFSLDPTLWGQFWTWVMADHEIPNLH